MNNNLLVKLLGPSALLLHYDTLVPDRWNWLRQRLPAKATSLKLLDVGCGNGAFTINLASMGYDSLGLSWDAPSLEKAAERAKLCGAAKAEFNLCDLRHLDRRNDLAGIFDIVVCFECIEHILDDKKLMRDVSNCLKKNGKLFLTAPNYDYIPITGGYEGKAAVSKTEDGGHVRIGYTGQELAKICENAGLIVDEIDSCSGVLSQKLTGLFRLLSRLHPLAGWLAILPFRPAIPLLDGFITRTLKWQPYSVCLTAHKPGDQ